MDQITHNVRRQNWLNIITACQNRTTDTTVRQWLSDNGIKEKAYYYWLRKFRREAAETNQVPAICSSVDVAFVEMPLGEISSEPCCDNTGGAAVIYKNGMTIEISNSINGQLLTLLLKEVARA